MDLFVLYIASFLLCDVKGRVHPDTLTYNMKVLTRFLIVENAMSMSLKSTKSRGWFSL